jgi:N6-L-threonylcarbamoyladenine synthase
MPENVNILAIETSCDETAASIVTNGRLVRSSVVASQVEIHQRYGGVVPEIASRAHIEKIYQVVEKALADAEMKPSEIDAVAIANQPGLVVSLIVGVTAAKSLAFMLGKPLIAVNHVHAHLQSALIEDSQLELPAIALIVSGGHSNIYKCSSAVNLELIGRTIDDAAGEAFDKVAQILELPYPGGPSIEKCAQSGNPKAHRFPRSMLGKDSLDFSFSGIKTAVLYHCNGQDMKGQSQVPNMSEKEKADIAASFQAAIVEVLVKKTMVASKQIRARTIVMGGGVAANTALREAMQAECDRRHLKLLIAPKKYCTDNAVMVASLAYEKYKEGLFADMALEAKASS